MQIHGGSRTGVTYTLGPGNSSPRTLYSKHRAGS